MAIDFVKDRIFVEGIGDQVFMRDFIKMAFSIEIPRSKLPNLIINCRGYNSLINVKSEFEDVKPGKNREGGRNLVVFDADFDNSGIPDHGYKKRLNYLESQKSTLDIEFNVFLFPNNKIDGSLETLIESCVHPDFSKNLDCWDALEKCVVNLGLTVPANKSKMYFYLETLYGKTKQEKEKIKDPNRDYFSKFWEFDFVNNKNLVELKNFLT